MGELFSSVPIAAAEAPDQVEDAIGADLSGAEGAEIPTAELPATVPAVDHLASEVATDQIPVDPTEGEDMDASDAPPPAAASVAPPPAPKPEKRHRSDRKPHNTADASDKKGSGSSKKHKKKR